MSWYPANSTIGAYNKHNYSALINISGGTRNTYFKSAVNASSKIGTSIASGQFGNVTRTADPQYVIKTMKFSATNSSDLVKIFLNEIRVGSTPGISAVGPQIYAFRLIRNDQGRLIKGQYIMDNLEKNGNIMTLSKYMKTYFSSSCPPHNHPLFKKLKQTLEIFWKITKGYHGDLHNENIIVVHDNDDVKKVKLIDYGAHKRFKVNIGRRTCFDDFMKIINKTFNNKVAKSGNTSFYPRASKVKLLFPKRGQGIRSNAQMLKGLYPHGGAIQNNFSKSLYQMMVRKPATRQVRNFLNLEKYKNPNLTNQNIKNKYKSSTHSNLFMSPTVHKIFMSNNNT